MASSTSDQAADLGAHREQITEPHNQGDELIVPSYSDDEERLADESKKSDDPRSRRRRKEEPEPDRTGPREPGYDMNHPQYHRDPREAIEIAQDNFRREGLR